MSELLRFLGLLLFFLSLLVVKSMEKFRNPLIQTGPDPWMAQSDGYYYFMVTLQDNLTIWKTQDPTDIKNAEEHCVWIPPLTGSYSKEIWAPELHQINGTWYIYFSADDGQNNNHRLYILQNSNPDPTKGKWFFRGKFETDTEDHWAIDMTVFEHNNVWYAVWSGWLGVTNTTQVLYIAEMNNPHEVKGDRVLISKPTLEWERFTTQDEIYVNEGPEVIKRDDNIFIVYSASYCKTDNYSLGMLQAKNTSNLLSPRSWTKHEKPVFSSLPEAQAYAIGHNTFFKSPDGKEDWIIYHGNPEAGQGCDLFRSARAQPFTWNADGTPNFGKPVPLKKYINKPSGLNTTSSYRLEGMKTGGYTGQLLLILLTCGGFYYYFAHYRRKAKKIESRTL